MKSNLCGNAVAPGLPGSGRRVRRTARGADQDESRGDRRHWNAQRGAGADGNLVARGPDRRRADRRAGGLRPDGLVDQGESIAQHAALPDRGRNRTDPAGQPAQPVTGPHAGPDERHPPAPVRAGQSAAGAAGYGQPGLAGGGLGGIPRGRDRARGDCPRWRLRAVRVGRDCGRDQRDPEERLSVSANGGCPWATPGS